MRTLHDGGEQRIQLIGDTGQRRVDNRRSKAFGGSSLNDLRNVVPIGGAGDAGASKFEHKPWLRWIELLGSDCLIVLKYIAQFFL